LFHARGPAVAKVQSPNDDSVRGTATVINSADLRPALALAAAAGLMRSTRMVRRRTDNNEQSLASINRLTQVHWENGH